MNHIIAHAKMNLSFVVITLITIQQECTNIIIYKTSVSNVRKNSPFKLLKVKYLKKAKDKKNKKKYNVSILWFRPFTNEIFRYYDNNSPYTMRVLFYFRFLPSLSIFTFNDLKCRVPFFTCDNRSIFINQIPRLSMQKT